MAVGTMKSKETTVETPGKEPTTKLSSYFKPKVAVTGFGRTHFDKTLTDSLPRLAALSGKNFIPDIDQTRTRFADQATNMSIEQMSWFEEKYFTLPEAKSKDTTILP